MHHSRKKPHQHLGSNSKCHAFSTASSSGSLRSFFRALGFIGSISCASVGIAQDAPLITITKSDKIAIGLNGIGGPDGATLLQLVQKDLQLSGAFSIGAPRTGNFQVGGNVSGSSLNGSLTDRSGKSVLSRSYSGSIRAQAHAFANDIVEAITGGKGIDLAINLVGGSVFAELVRTLARKGRIGIVGYVDGVF